MKNKFSQIINLISLVTILIFFIILFYYLINLIIALRTLQSETDIINKGIEAYKLLQTDYTIEWFDKCPDYYLVYQHPCDTNLRFRNITGCYCNNTLVYANNYDIHKINLTAKF